VIAVDWGTSSLRAYRLDGQGRVLESRASDRGILNVPQGGFRQALEEQIGGWAEGPIVMSGMVGSRQGWVEVPYVECPAGFDEIKRSLKEVFPRIWIVPGVLYRGAVPDVMRGEETQVLGSGVEGTLCLPGTHSKWVEVANGRIVRFSTHMTGEVYAVLKQHSILGRMMEEGEDEKSFLQGVARSGDPGGLLHHLFGVRTRGLMGELAAAAASSYLSGIVIGHEIRAEGKNFAVLGEARLATLYQRAARALGLEARMLDPSAAVRCLFRLGQEARGMLAP
jgi:2-dehydro-3-deoxygalactonokinase